jgi:hypothetical protein
MWLVAGGVGLVAPAAPGAGRAAAGPVSVSVSTGPARASAVGKAVIAKFRTDAHVLHDGHGHYVVLIPFDALDTIFYGDGKAFYQQRVTSTYAAKSDGNTTRVFWAPNSSVRGGELELKGGARWTAQCGNRTTPLTELDPGRAHEMLAHAAFNGPFWTRSAYLLARDARGRYYFVDKLRDDRSWSERHDDPNPPRGYRLFIGKRGSLKQVTLTDSAPDSKGVVLSTRSGDLAFDETTHKALWSHGKRQTELVYLPVADNITLIYRDLGLYRRLGTPCDDM